MGSNGFTRAALIAGICVLIASASPNRGEVIVGDYRDYEDGRAMPSRQKALLAIFPGEAGEIIEEVKIAPLHPPIAAIHSFGKPIEVAPVERSSRRTFMFESEESDVRAEAIDLFFERYDGPLAGFGEVFVEEADKSGIPYALLPAIGFIESSGGKNLFRPNNPFGWGKRSFASFEEAIAEVSANLGGNVPETAKYYGRRSLRSKLENYNLDPEYPDSVFRVLDEIMEIESNLR